VLLGSAPIEIPMSGPGEKKVLVIVKVYSKSCWCKAKQDSNGITTTPKNWNHHLHLYVGGLLSGVSLEKKIKKKRSHLKYGSTQSFSD